MENRLGKTTHTYGSLDKRYNNDADISIIALGPFST
jgi:hypothetical protein